MRVRIEVLGPIRVVVGGDEVAVRGAIRRRLLVALAARRGTEYRAEALAEAIWFGSPSAAASLTLQSHVAHLRRLLEPGRGPGEPWRIVESVPGGYRLAVERVEFDADELIALLHSAGSLADDRAIDLLDRAMTLVRGPAYDGLREVDAVEIDAARLDEVARSVATRRLAVLGRLRRHEEVIASARGLVEADRLHEAVWLHLANSLAETGRRADALDALRELRSGLQEELGVDLSAEAAAVRAKILDGASRIGPSAPLRYARRDGVAIAWQSVGSGPTLVAVPPFAQNIEVCWQDPHHRRLIERAAQRCRFVHFDKRGTGMSDRAAGFSLEERVEDFRSVLDDAQIERATLAAVSEAGPLAIAFASRYPDRVAGLVLINTFARILRDDDYPDGVPHARYAALTRAWEECWGTEPRTMVGWFAPSLSDDPAYVEWFGHYMRQSCSPGTLARINAANVQLDVRPLLNQVGAPTQVVHRAHDRVAPVAWGRWLADHMPSATYTELPGADHLPWVGAGWETIVDIAVRHTLDDT